MPSAVITQEMIDNPLADAVMVNHGDDVAMSMDIVPHLRVYFGVLKDQLPEDVDYTTGNIIDMADYR